MHLPLDEAGFGVHHAVDDQFDQPVVHDGVLLPEIVVGDHVAQLPLAVRAGRADVLSDRRIEFIFECVQDLLQLLTAADLVAPVVEVMA